jgi:hypothetical protein
MEGLDMRKSYEPAMPRLALRLIAVAMAIATMALLVVVPAELETVTASAPEMTQQASVAQAQTTRSVQ